MLCWLTLVEHKTRYGRTMKSGQRPRTRMHVRPAVRRLVPEKDKPKAVRNHEYPANHVLTETFRLHDIDDVEALCTSIVQRSGLELRYHEREDLIAYLITTCWELSQRWDPPPQYQRTGFQVWATTTLRKRVAEWQRTRNRRTRWVFKDRVYERPPVHVESLDSELGRTVREGAVDATPDRSPDLARVLGEGARLQVLATGGLDTPPHE